MAGVHFSFVDLKQLLALNIGISERLDENRAESFTILYCNFKDIDPEAVSSSLRSILRNSDAVVNHEEDFFFVLPYTDKYGANIVKRMFDDAFETSLDHFLLSYPADGETPEELLGFMQDSVSTFYKYDISCLDRFARVIE